jgi:cytochrome c-type biogenesis protein CcsB
VLQTLVSLWWHIDTISGHPAIQLSGLPTFPFIALTYALLWAAALAYTVHARTDNRPVGRLATGITAVSWGLLTVGIVRRGLAAGHWPLTNRYEFALCLVWSILAIYVLVELSWRERRAGAYVVAIALLVATYAITRPPDAQGIAPLLPALRSAWLQIHVLTTLVAYGAFGVAAGLGLMQLVRRKHTGGKMSSDGNGQGGTLEGLSPIEGVECTTERAVTLGFPWLTLGILTGAIWAQVAWGRYWDWDPKETWALVTWLWYLLTLHLSPLSGWRGRRLAGLVVVGFGVVLFTFVGVPWLVRTVRLESLHGF